MQSSTCVVHKKALKLLNRSVNSGSKLHAEPGNVFYFGGVTAFVIDDAVWQAKAKSVLENRISYKVNKWVPVFRPISRAAAYFMGAGVVLN